MSSTEEVKELIWVSPLNTKFVTPGVEKKCPWPENCTPAAVSPHFKQEW